MGKDPYTIGIALTKQSTPEPRDALSATRRRRTKGARRLLVSAAAAAGRRREPPPPAPSPAAVAAGRRRRSSGAGRRRRAPPPTADRRGTLTRAAAAGVATWRHSRAHRPHSGAPSAEVGGEQSGETGAAIRACTAMADDDGHAMSCAPAVSDSSTVRCAPVAKHVDLGKENNDGQTQVCIPTKGQKKRKVERPSCPHCDADNRPLHTKLAYPAEKPQNDAPNAWKKQVTDEEFDRVKNECIRLLGELEEWLDGRHEDAQRCLYRNEKEHRDYKQFKRPTGYWLKFLQGLENTGTCYPIYLALMRCLTPWDLGNVDGSCGGGHCACVDPTDNMTMRRAMEANNAFAQSYINYDAMYNLRYAVMNGRIIDIVFRFCNGTKTPIFVFNLMGTSSNFDYVFTPLAESAASSDFIQVCASGSHVSNLSTKRWFSKSLSWKTEWEQMFHVSREIHKLSRALADFNAKFDLETGRTLVECWREMKYLIPDMSEHKSEVQLHEENQQRKRKREAEERQRKEERKRKAEEERKRKAEVGRQRKEERKRKVMELRNEMERRVAEAKKMNQEERASLKKQNNSSF
ncbi:hypothetical protein THAOC_02174 [Thalassiosira oceanica]|uniref:Uncharacterized protein n=1 Tax=Thalassiosira oceanica TaxID=159749 RepID=K0TGB4_THAOC|nr:hypothetical protein THAOC_02174 [Thalassiosira oceanica]|eukprot:EJK76084.1 hypothetical protein THAOC_02174 [Thalassiosira oceanica]